jgi:hypothetical protein
MVFNAVEDVEDVAADRGVPLSLLGNVLCIAPVLGGIPVGDVVRLFKSDSPGMAASVAPALTFAIRAIYNTVIQLGKEIRNAQMCFVRMMHNHKEDDLGVDTFIGVLQRGLAKHETLETRAPKEPAASAVIVRANSPGLRNVVSTSRTMLADLFGSEAAADLFEEICHEVYVRTKEYALAWDVATVRVYQVDDDEVEYCPEACMRQFILHVLSQEDNTKNVVLGYLAHTQEGFDLAKSHFGDDLTKLTQQLNELREEVKPYVERLKVYEEVYRQSLLPAIQRAYPYLGWCVVVKPAIPKTYEDAFSERSLKLVSPDPRSASAASAAWEAVKHEDPDVDAGSDVFKWVPSTTDANFYNQYGAEVVAYRDSMWRAQGLLSRLMYAINGDVGRDENCSYARIGYGDDYRHNKQPYIIIKRDDAADVCNKIWQVMLLCAAYSRRPPAGPHISASDAAALLLLADKRTWVASSTW